jgi:hypothetical protein
LAQNNTLTGAVITVWINNSAYLCGNFIRVIARKSEPSQHQSKIWNPNTAPGAVHLLVLFILQRLTQLTGTGGDRSIIISSSSSSSSQLTSIISSSSSAAHHQRIISSSAYHQRN